MPACGADSILFNSLTGLDRRPFILSQTLRLIRVFDCAEEVAFFYRKFLSRRLLTRRFLSTDMEQSVLDALGVRAHPKMSLFSQMVKDVTRSEHLFSAFKVRWTVCVRVCVRVCACVWWLACAVRDGGVMACVVLHRSTAWLACPAVIRRPASSRRWCSNAPWTASSCRRLGKCRRSRAFASGCRPRSRRSAPRSQSSMPATPAVGSLPEN